MSKILLAADIHFGVPGRLQDIVYSCEVMQEYALRNDIDLCLILGDLFHDRRYVEIDVLSAAYNFFDQSKELGLQWLTFPGNHDMYLKYSWDVNSLTCFKYVIKLYEDVSLITINERRFWIIPFIAYEKVYNKVLQLTSKHRRKGDILLTHVGVSGSTLNSCFLFKEWNHVNFLNDCFEKVFTGHYHISQCVRDKVYYPGSPIAFKFDEGNCDHGFLTYDLETSQVEFHDIIKLGLEYFPSKTPPPKFITLMVDDLPNLDVQDIQYNNIRMTFDKEPTETEKSNVKKQIELLGAKSVRWLNLYQKQENLTTVQKEYYVSSKNLFKSFIEKDEKSKEYDSALLLTLHDSIVAEGDEIYYSEYTEEQ